MTYGLAQVLIGVFLVQFSPKLLTLLREFCSYAL